MFSTKLDVDKHVENSLKKVNSEKERIQRYFTIAKLYFNVKAYEQARGYVSTYLSENFTPEAYKLLGDVLCKLDRKEAALDAYLNSLQLNSNQSKLILTACELSADDDIACNEVNARYLYDLAKQQCDVHHPVLLALHEKLLITEGQNPQEIVEHFLAELESRPTDVLLRIRLVRHLLQQSKIREAYKHTIDIHYLDCAQFANSVRWHETVADVLNAYQTHTANEAVALDWEFWFFLVATLERLTALTLDVHQSYRRPAAGTNSTTVSANLLVNLDQTLFNAITQCNSKCPQKQLLQEFKQHYTAQLVYHLATLALKRAKDDGILLTKLTPAKICDVTSPLLPLLFAAYNGPTLSEVGAGSWRTEIHTKLLQKWHREACFRRSQMGHILLAWSRTDPHMTCERAQQFSSLMWREKLYKNTFSNYHQHLLKMATSYFLTTADLNSIETRLPNHSDLRRIDEIAQQLYPDQLHYYVWICANYTKLSEFTLKSFEGLPYSNKKLSPCSAESITVLDLYTFIVCATCKSSRQTQNMECLRDGSTVETLLLPAALTEQLCTPEQAKFFTAAYLMYRNDDVSGPTNYSELRSCLINGLNAIRLGLPTPLMVRLARIFADAAECSATTRSQMEFLRARAEFYWAVALPRLQNSNMPPRRGQCGTLDMSGKGRKSSLFNYYVFNNTHCDIARDVKDGKIFLAQCSIAQKRYEIAKTYLSDIVDDPYGTFYLAQIFEAMATEDNVTRQQQVALLTQAKDQLYTTLDRLRHVHVAAEHPLNIQLAPQIERIEELLTNLEISDNNGDVTDATTDEIRDTFTNSNASFTQTLYNQQSTSTSTPTSKLYAGRSSSITGHVPPSPERLDAQMRQMNLTKDLANHQLVEQMKQMVEMQKSLVQEFKGLQGQLSHLPESVGSKIGDKLKDAISSSLAEYKPYLDDLPSIRTVTDMVNELKREVNEMKANQAGTGMGAKTTTPSGGAAQKLNTTITDEDLYNFAMNSDFNNMSNNSPVVVGGANSNDFGSSLYANFGLRTAPPPPPPVYQHPSFPPVQLPSSVPNLTYSLGNSGLFFEPPGMTPTAAPTASNMTVSGALFKPDNRPPVNVVITTSDPLPSTSQQPPPPILAVTIPPQHLKGSSSQLAVSAGAPVHNYQIPMPPLVNPIPTVPSFLKNTDDISIIKLPIEKAITTAKPIEETVKTVEDPCPDFQPIIPLPDEITVTTGEEAENILFESRAKLYRFHGNEWRERGVGILKILENPHTHKVRVLMRRDQIHKICANHYITECTVLTPKENTDRAYVWAAQDFADGEITLEKFCVRFKDVDIGENFQKVFNKIVQNVDNNVLGEEGGSEATTESLPEVESETRKQGEEECLFDVKSVALSRTRDFARQQWEDLGASGHLKVSKDTNNKVQLVWNAATITISEPLTKMMKFTASGETTVMWTTCSYEMGDFKLAFQCHNDADWFLRVVSGWQQLLNTDTDDNSANVDSKHARVEKSANSVFSFGTAASGAVKLSWRCCNCYIDNDAKENKCVACDSPKLPPSITTSSTTVISSVLTTPEKPKEMATNQFTFNLDGWADSFKPKPGSWECATCLVRNEADRNECISCETPKGNEKQSSLAAFNFGKDVTTKKTPTTTTTTPTFGFGFGSKLNFDNSTGDKFVFGSPQTTKVTFDFTTKMMTPPRQHRNSGGSAGGLVSIVSSDENGDNNNPEEVVENDDDNDQIYFKPVIPLPDKVDVMTGEEQEDVLYAHRAKLYRFTDDEWKERGLGDIKILKHQTTGKLRVLMRRDQVLKICLNHHLTGDINYTLKDNDKSWLFRVADFSEGYFQNDTFCVRFKNAEIAQEFKQAVDDAINGKRLAENVTKIAAETLETSTVVADGENDVEVVRETVVSAEDEAEAQKLQLPSKFFAYRQMEDCSCEQCKSDDLYFGDQLDKFTTSSGAKQEQSPVNLLKNATICSPSVINGGAKENIAPKPALAVVTPPKFTSIFGGAGTKTTFFGGFASTTPPPPPTTTTPTLFGQIGSSFGSGKSLFGDVPSIFGEKSESEDNHQTSDTSGHHWFRDHSQTSIFGMKPTVPTSIFGGAATSSSSIFGGTDSTTKTPAIAAIADSTSFTSQLKEGDAAVLNVSEANDISFATLASTTTGGGQQSLFTATESVQKPFSFLGAGTPVFAAATTTMIKAKIGDNSKDPTNNDDDNEDGAAAAGGTEDCYDPHYEPIVPLPDLVEIGTGEEEETVMFCERAKLYRYASETKEWKERGVGQIKVLYHPTKNTYRLLLRREQVHKIVLNQLLTPDIDMKTMATSDKSLVWVANNYVDNEYSIDQLAVRFRNVDIVKQFAAAVQKAAEHLARLRDATPSIDVLYEVAEDEEDREGIEEEEDQQPYDNDYEDVEEEDDGEYETTDDDEDDYRRHRA